MARYAKGTTRCGCKLCTDCYIRVDNYAVCFRCARGEHGENVAAAPLADRIALREHRAMTAHDAPGSTETRICRTDGCERTTRPHSPYCAACFAAVLDAAYAPAFWPTDAEINDMAREREGTKS